MVGTYEVDGQGMVVRQVGLAVDGQKCEALALRGELAGELLRGHTNISLGLRAVVAIRIAVHLRLQLKND